MRRGPVRTRVPSGSPACRAGLMRRGPGPQRVPSISSRPHEKRQAPVCTWVPSGRPLPVPQSNAFRYRSSRAAACFVPISQKDFRRSTRYKNAGRGHAVDGATTGDCLVPQSCHRLQVKSAAPYAHLPQNVEAFRVLCASKGLSDSGESRM